MANKDKMLQVYFNTSDESIACYKMGEETVTKTLLTTDSIYIGYKKPIRNIFIELKTPNANAVTLTVNKWNGSTWVAATIIDETKGLKKSNFIYIDEAEDLSKKTTVNGKELYWLKLNLSANSSAIVFNGINMLFCCEYDLMKYEPAIKNFYPRDLKSHVLSMAAARDTMLRKINNSNQYFYKSIDPLTANPDLINAEDFTQFDMFHVDELREAATFLTLHILMLNRSDADGEDMYARKAAKYWQEYESAYQRWNGSKLTVDLNKDGIEDESDKIMAVARGSFTR